MADEKRFMPYGTGDEKNRMISEGGPVVFDPLQVDSRETLPPYDSQFSFPETLKNFAKFFEGIPFDEAMLEMLLQRHLRTKRTPRSTGYLRGVIGELFIEHIIRRAVTEIPGIQRFPKKYSTDDFEIRARREMGFDLFKRVTNEQGEQQLRTQKEIDGLIHVQGDDGKLLTVVLESKISESNLGRRSLNSAIRPSGAKLYTDDMIEIFGAVGFGVAAPVDRIAETNPLQRHFTANGGLLLAFPFTYEQANEIAKRVAGPAIKPDSIN